MTTMKILRLPCLLVAAATVASLAGATSLELLPLADGDLATTTLSKSAPSGARIPNDDQPVQVSWLLDPELALASRPQAPVAESRSFWFQVSAADLGAGVAIDTTAPGAVVRVNPLDATDVILDPRSFELVDATKRVRIGANAMDQLVSAEELKASDSPFPSGTAAFRISAELGAGSFQLRIPGLERCGSSRFIVHVFEPDSAAVAHLSCGSGAILEGEGIEASAQLTIAGTPVDVNDADATLIAPDGRRSPLELDDRDGTLIAATRIGAAAPGGGLWEIEIRLDAQTDDRRVRRTVRAAFAVAAATARLDGRVERVDGRDLVLRLGVETAAVGRYEVRGILWGTTTEGAMAPIAVAHSAATLGTGRSELDLVFTGDLVAQAPARAPYELRDLQLMDQTRMGVLHRQERALVID